MSFVQFIEAAQKIRAAIAEVKSSPPISPIEAVLANAPDGAAIAPSSDPRRRRLYLLATTFVERGMAPQDAYDAAKYYVCGPGRGQSWVSALNEIDCVLGDR